MVSLPESIGQCTKLATLILGDISSGTDALLKLPDSLGHCKALVTLDISGCVNLLELPGLLRDEAEAEDAGPDLAVQSHDRLVVAVGQLERLRVGALPEVPACRWRRSMTEQEP